MLQLNVRILVDFDHVPYIGLLFLYFRIRGLRHHRKRSGEKRFSTSGKFHTADLIPLMAGRNIWGLCDRNDVFPYWRMKICWKLITRNEWVKRRAVRKNMKALLCLTFCIYLVREIVFFFNCENSGKCEKVMSVATMISSELANWLTYFTERVFGFGC